MNSNKVKGDRAELAAKAACIRCGFPDTEKTRAGYARDHGDLHLVTIPGVRGGPSVIAQVKNVATPNWTGWLTQLADQQRHAKADFSFLIVKRPGMGLGHAEDWLAVTTVAEHCRLLRAAGYGTTPELEAMVPLTHASCPGSPSLDEPEATP